jgi:neuroblastoma-amplified sequence
MVLSSTTTILIEDDLCKRWIEISDDEITPETIRQYLEPTADDLWVVVACAERLLDDAAVQRSLLELGLKRTEPAKHRSRAIYKSADAEGEFEESEGAETKEHLGLNELVSRFRDEPVDAQLCSLRSVLLERLDRLNTFVEICQDALPPAETDAETVEDEWADDPWGDAFRTSSSTSKGSLPLGLPEFLTFGLLEIACLLASQDAYAAVGVLMRRHGSYLWQYRFAILESIPEQARASDFRELLPRFNPGSGTERGVETKPWRAEVDWTEESAVRDILAASDIPFLFHHPEDSILPEPHPVPLEEVALAHWYRARVERIVSASGVLDSALSLVQHAASQGLQGLDEVAEDLLLLSRLVYDVPRPDDATISAEWSLTWWKSLSPAAAINALLAHACRENVAKLIQKVLNPYLFVLESRAERQGHPDPDLPKKLLYDYILQAPFDVVAGIFEASKPTLPPAQRLLRDNEDMARLALACLYGSESLDQWPTMSQIFECLPAWNIQEDEDEGDEADTTMASLAAYLVPSTAQAQVTPSDLYVFFHPLPLTALSRALDFLDVHLESGEILSRWSVPAPLRWFLRSRDNIAEQRAWANRMSRRAGDSEDRLETQADWEWLLEDMLKLSGSGDAGLKGAFCLLNRQEILRIFFSGLLSSGGQCTFLWS